jgi:agmatine deiminase
MKNLSIIIICLSLLSGSILFGQEQSTDEFLPIGLTQEEMQRLHEIGMYHQTTDPPEGIIRNPAEWEPSEGVIIRWPLGISVAIVAEISEDLVVTTIVPNSSEEYSARNAYIAGGVNMVNAQFIIAPTNSIWTRDYGPWFIFVDDSMAIVDHIYNRPRPLDDVIPQVIGTQWGLDVYGMDLIHTGGNHMSDGLGMSVSTRLVYNENPGRTAAQVDSIMMAYLGNDYTVLDYIESGGIHHIDCWAKFLSPTTIIVKDVPPSNPSYQLLNARAQYLSQQISAWGVPYTIIRVYCPSGTAYTNSIILNDKVLVPVFGSGYDNVALHTYRDAMPGYEVLGFSGSWYDNDAIHCRVMGVPDRGMLFVDHIPLNRQSDTLAGYEISATIIACSDSALIADSLKIYYKVDNGSWEYNWLNSSTYRNTYIGNIPAQSAGSLISYYLKAADNSGRVETHPYMGAADAHTFMINMPPEISSADTLTCETGEYFAFYPTFSDPDDTVHIISYSEYPAWCAVQNDSLVGIAPGSYEPTGFTVKVADLLSYSEKNITLIVYPVGYAYFPGDANMANGQYPPQVVGADVTYMVNYFRGHESSQPCYLSSFWASADINGDCSVIGSDVTRLVNYFRGISIIEWCPDYAPLWLTPADFPAEAPPGWPGCE